MKKFFIYVSEMGKGTCPIHEPRMTMFGLGVVRHACGCLARKGESPMDDHDVRKAVQNNLVSRRQYETTSR